MNFLVYFFVFIFNCVIFLIYKLIVFVWLYFSKKEYKYIKFLFLKIVFFFVEFIKFFCSLYGINKFNLKYVIVVCV